MRMERDIGKQALFTEVRTRKIGMSSGTRLHRAGNKPITVISVTPKALNRIMVWTRPARPRPLSPSVKM